jgi:hypothetical protein
LRTPAAFATMLISQEDSGIGLVMHRGAHFEGGGPIGNWIVRARAGEHSPSAHDV